MRYNNGGYLFASDDNLMTIAHGNRVISDLARGAQEQSSGLEEVNSSVNAMDRVTQRNATMAEQANAASRTLAHEATGLAELIGRFNLGGGSRQGAGRARAA